MTAADTLHTYWHHQRQRGDRPRPVWGVVGRAGVLHFWTTGRTQAEGYAEGMPTTLGARALPISPTSGRALRLLARPTALNR